MARLARRLGLALSCVISLVSYNNFWLLSNNNSNLLSLIPYQSKIVAKRSKCVSDRRWISETLERSSGQESWPTCAQLDFYSMTEVDCLRKEAIAKTFFSDQMTQRRLRNCSTYFSQIRTVAFDKATIDEMKTPLAFSIVAHNQLSLLEAQLAAIFRPHNAYCIFVDSKALDSFKNGVQQLVDCYKEQFPATPLFMESQAFPVFWADISLLKADVLCLKELLKRHNSWKYFINQAGTSLPQVPVKIMSKILGNKYRDVVISGPMPKKLSRRILFVHKRPKSWDLIEDNRFAPLDASATMNEDRNRSFMYPERPIETSQRKERPPFGLKIFKGEREIALTRRTASFAVEHPIGQALWNWVQNVAFPEEIFFNTLVRVDKSYPLLSLASVRQVTDKRRDFTHGLCARRTLWYFNRRNCFGVMKRHLCNLDLRDLPEVYEKQCLFINKFDLTVDARIVHCLHDFLTK